MNTITIEVEKTGRLITINLDNVGFWEWSLFDSEGETPLYQLTFYFVCHRIQHIITNETQRDSIMLGLAKPSICIFKAIREA